MPSPTAAIAAATAATAATATKAYEHTPATPQPPRVLYRLAAVVCHYGQHSFGHYVCFRRRPRGAGRVGPPRLDEGFSAVPGRGWLRASDDAVREVGIETVLQEESGAFMLYYERVRNEDKPPVPAWSSPHSRAATDDGDDGDAGEIGGGGQEEKARTVKCESGEEVEETEEVPVIKARVVRSVSLGRGDVFEGASVSVKQEVEVGNPDSEARLLRPSSPAPAQPGHVKVEHVVELLPTPAVSTTEGPSPIPDAPAVDEPPIRTVPQSVDR